MTFGKAILLRNATEILMTVADDPQDLDIDKDLDIDQGLDIDEDLDQDVVAIRDGMYADIDYDKFEKSGFSLHHFLCPKDPDRVVGLLKVLETKAAADNDCEAAQFLRRIYSEHKVYVRFRRDLGR
jgi:hypothetical protein